MHVPHPHRPVAEQLGRHRARKQSSPRPRQQTHCCKPSPLVKQAGALAPQSHSGGNQDPNYFGKYSTALLPRLSPSSFLQLPVERPPSPRKMGRSTLRPHFLRGSRMRTESIHMEGRRSHSMPLATQASGLPTLKNEFTNMKNSSIRFHFPKIAPF